MNKMLMTMLSTAALLSSFTLRADVLGAEVGIGSWWMEPTGTLNYRGDNADLENDLHLSDQSNLFAWIAFEHPTPILPNVKLVYTRLETDGDGVVSRSFQFGSILVNLNQRVVSDLKLNQGDVILYYELLDNWVSLDAGLNLKILDGEAQLVTATSREQTDFTAVVPQLYAMARFDLPLTGLSAAGSVAGISYSGSRIVDLNLSLRYTFDPGFAIEGGWKQQDLVLDDVDDITSDIKLKGPYIAVALDF